MIVQRAKTMFFVPQSMNPAHERAASVQNGNYNWQTIGGIKRYSMSVPDSAAQLQRRFGQAVRAERKAQNLTQQAVAFAADLSLTYVGEIERGERMVSLHTLVRLSTALKMNPAELLAKV
jgi:ribosome-binding protein aMBF1 (putative translation factor)